MNHKPFLLLLLLCSLLCAPRALLAHTPPWVNDYPTEARADYVFGCMASNAFNPDLLRRCSCSIDIIASILPYKRYVEAETVLSLRQTGGERMSIFKTTALSNNLVKDLRRAQAEAEILCF